MTDKAWTLGMAQLVACCRDRDLTTPMQTLRGATYRKHLGHLGDEAWGYAVGIACQGEWFPAIETLLLYAGSAPAPARTGIAEECELTPEQKRQAAVKGLEEIRARLEAVGVLAGPVVKPMPEAKS